MEADNDFEVNYNGEEDEFWMLGVNMGSKPALDDFIIFINNMLATPYSQYDYEWIYHLIRKFIENTIMRPMFTKPGIPYCDYNVVVSKIERRIHMIKAFKTNAVYAAKYYNLDIEPDYRYYKVNLSKIQDIINCDHTILRDYNQDIQDELYIYLDHKLSDIARYERHSGIFDEGYCDNLIEESDDENMDEDNGSEAIDR